MTDARKIAEGLTEAQRRAVTRLGLGWQFPSRATFAANGAWSLQRKGLAEYQSMLDGKHGRVAYRLTPLGLAVRAILLERTADDQ